jgi:hypothetical protein
MRRVCGRVVSRLESEERIGYVESVFYRMSWLITDAYLWALAGFTDLSTELTAYWSEIRLNTRYGC